MLKEITAPIDEVAEALGMPPRSLKRQLQALHDKKGFPMPLPGGKWRWSRSAITTWIKAAGRPEVQAPEHDEEEAQEDEPGNSLGNALVLDFHRALRERYVGAK